MQPLWDAVMSLSRALALAILTVCCPIGSARAACTNPAGHEADQIYNRSYHTYQFCNGSSWIAFAGAGTAGPMVLISTQTANNSASLQFTSLPTTYNSLFLNCAGLISSVDAVAMDVVVGEGAGPTWETGSSYIVAALQNTAGGNQNDYQTSGAALDSSVCNSNTIPTSIKLFLLGQVGSSAIYKLASYQASCYYSPSTTYADFAGSGYWSADTNPITGLEIILSSGNITSGTCSLYGIK
jgi:hypothetical protein